VPCWRARTVGVPAEYVRTSDWPSPPGDGGTYETAILGPLAATTLNYVLNTYVGAGKRFHLCTAGTRDGGIPAIAVTVVEGVESSL
jgi:hypothetical protein